MKQEHQEFFKLTSEIKTIGRIKFQMFSYKKVLVRKKKDYDYGMFDVITIQFDYNHLSVSSCHNLFF